jgi:hypothetical protein
MGMPICPFAPKDGCSGECVFWNNSRSDCIIRAVKQMNLEEHESLLTERKLMSDLKSMQTLEAEFDFEYSEKAKGLSWDYEVGSY